jgi:hypothetical protein
MQGQIALKELGEGTRGRRHCSRLFGSSEVFAMINAITKTATWKVDAARIDSHSENEQQISTPHNMLEVSAKLCAGPRQRANYATYTENTT